MNQVVLGSDHAGYWLKEELKRRLQNQGYSVLDVGCNGEAVDYPDIARDVCMQVRKDGVDFGLVCCGTGIGVSIAANKCHGIRAALCTDVYSARMCKEHNNANVLAFGARTIGVEHAWEMVCAYMNAEYQGGVHDARVAKIMQLENEPER